MAQLLEFRIQVLYADLGDFSGQIYEGAYAEDTTHRKQ
jgi:hypothetical protein